jgi:hypothetical protein
LPWQFNLMDKETAKVEGHTHLVRDLKSQAIINTDSSAYGRYMARKRKQKEQNDEIRSVIRDVNELKTEMREIKDLLIGMANGRH